MNNPFALNPLGANRIKTPRMLQRDSKSQCASKLQWNNSGAFVQLLPCGKGPPRTAGGGVGNYFYEKDNLFSSQGSPRVNLSESSKSQKDSREKGAEKVRRLDNDGRAKGIAAGLPGAHNAGQMNKDFKLALYGEYTHQGPQDSSTPKSTRGRVVGFVQGSLDPLSTCDCGSEPSSAPATARIRRVLPPVCVDETPRIKSMSLRTPLDLSPISLPHSTPRQGSTIQTNMLAFPGLFAEGGFTPARRTPTTPRGRTPLTPRELMSNSLAGSLSRTASPLLWQDNQSTISNYDPTNEEGRPDSSANHRKKPTYQAKKPLSQWKGLGVPNFYLATLEGCSVGKVPSVFFEKEPAVSTAGNVQVQPFRHEPLPSDPKHQRASMEYFAPKGFGKLRCEICDRCFMNEQLLVQHNESTGHQYRAAKLQGFRYEGKHKKIKQMNVLDCGEFDESYHAMKSDSDSESLGDDENVVGDTIEHSEKQAAKRESLKLSKRSQKQDLKEWMDQNTKKMNFFEFVRDYLQQEANNTIVSNDTLTQIKEEMEEAKENGHTLKAAPLHEDEPEAVMQDLRVTYLSKCRELNIMPKASVITRHRQDKGTFDLKGHGVGDATVQALAPCVRNMKNLEYMFLCDNRMEETGAAEILEAVRNHLDLKTIDLSVNQIGRLGIATLSRSLNTLPSLTTLDLSKNRLMDQEISVLMHSIHEAGQLETLNLSDNSIASNGAEAIGNAMHKCQKLAALNLSWNAIRGKGCAQIGLALAQNSTLTDLNLSWNGLGGSKHFDCWADTFEMNKALLTLDLSHNGLCERACLIICENLKFNEVITNVILDDNPLGPVGAKLVFKLMDSFGEERSLKFDKCNFDSRSKICSFNPSKCAGELFSLDLSQTYDRAVALVLARMAGKNIKEQWQNAKLDKAQIDSSQYLTTALPRDGILEFTFLAFAMKATKENVMSHTTFNKLTAMVSASDRSESDRLAQMAQIANEIVLTCAQLAHMIDEAQPSSRGKIFLIASLFSRLVDRDEFFEVEGKLTKSEIAQLRLQLGPMWSFSEQNPTGHYKLDLELDFDRELASKVLELNNSERQHRKDEKLFDTSDDGHYMNFRNETYNGEPFRWTGVWRIPQKGILEFDYVSTQRPRNDTVPLAEDYFYELLYFLGDKSMSDSEKLENVLRPYTVEEYFTSEQVRLIVRKFVEPAARVEACVMTHRRVIDLENWLKPMMLELRILSNGGVAIEYGQSDDQIPSSEEDREINVVLSRLGWLNCWNPLDPEIMYRLQLDNRDQNLVAQCLVELAVKETGENWMGEQFNGHEFELPSTWVKEVPHNGFLEVYYHTDHMSDETTKCKSKRGDNFEVRLKWFKKTLCYAPGMIIEDDAFEGLNREDWSKHRSWRITKHVPLYDTVNEAMYVHGYQGQHVRWLMRRGYHLTHMRDVSHISSDTRELEFACQKTGIIWNFDELLEHEKKKAVQQGRMPSLKQVIDGKFKPIARMLTVLQGLGSDQLQMTEATK